MITVDSLTPIERSAYDEGYHDGVKEGITRGMNLMLGKCKPVMRSLWLARAERAHCEMISLKYDIHNANWQKWQCVESKCRNYADKFKEDK